VIIEMQFERCAPLGAHRSLRYGDVCTNDAFAFYAPSNGTLITGTVNQLAYPDTSFRFMLKIVTEK